MALGNTLTFEALVASTELDGVTDAAAVTNTTPSALRLESRLSRPAESRVRVVGGSVTVGAGVVGIGVILEDSAPTVAVTVTVTTFTPLSPTGVDDVLLAA